MNGVKLLEQDHKTVEGLCARFEQLGPRALKGKHAVVQRIIKELAVHAAIEETILHPAVTKAFGGNRLEELGDTLVAARKTAAVHPHPKLPDEPPSNVLAAPAVAVVDKVRDAGRKPVRAANA